MIGTAMAPAKIQLWGALLIFGAFQAFLGFSTCLFRVWSIILTLSTLFGQPCLFSRPFAIREPPRHDVGVRMAGHYVMSVHSLRRYRIQCLLRRTRSQFWTFTNATQFPESCAGGNLTEEVMRNPLLRIMQRKIPLLVFSLSPILIHHKNNEQRGDILSTKI